jgi:hypothetical protein
VLVVVCWLAGAMIARRVVRSRPEWFALNRYVGGGLGAVEGLLIALCVIWVPSAMRPVAAMRSAAEEQQRVYDAMEAGTYALGQEAPRAQKMSLADWLLARAKDVDDSVVGRAVDRANPMSSSQVLDVAEDYLAVLRDEDASRMLQNSDVWARMLALSSVAHARSVVEQDASLNAIFEAEGLNISTLRTLLDSPAVLKVMDATDIRAELEPLAPQLIEAIRQARASMRQEPAWQPEKR